MNIEHVQKFCHYLEKLNVKKIDKFIVRDFLFAS
jgi:hypothetical protein